MLQTEYLRSLNSNYERILLDKKPEEQKYQYCILSRGGIKGLLPCSLRYINGLAYLYYDISSKQNITQLYGKKPIDRNWIKDFLWSFREIQLELARFLLDEQNVLWYPQQVYQDLENNIFSFLYVPYYEGENGFQQLLEYFVEHIDYDDGVLVECIYKMYEQYERVGRVYLQEQIFEDAKILESGNELEQPEDVTERAVLSEQKMPLETDCATETLLLEEASDSLEVKTEKRGFFSFLEGKKKKEKEMRENYRETMQSVMSGHAVAEEVIYEEEVWGKTIYVEEPSVPERRVPRLCTPEGRLVVRLDKSSLTIGKKKEDVDLVLDDVSVSRMHARITREQENMYLEDLNSTNGTFKNGLRMQPYEKRKLEEGDEIKFGKTTFLYC